MAVDIIARGMAATADSNAEIARKISAPDYDPTETYNKNDIVFYDGKLYICTGTNVTGAFDPSKWSQIIISDELTAIINRLAQIDNPMLIKGVVTTVGDLPQNAEPGWVYFVGQTGDTDYDEYVYTEDDGWQHIGSAKIIVDSELSLTSANPVENRVITAALNTKLKSIAAAEAFDPEVTYTTGDYMTLDGELFRCDPINGQALPIGENLLVTYADRLKDSTYGYQNSRYWESYGNPGTITINDNMYISGSIPIKQNTTYRIYESGWSAYDSRYFALAIFTNGTNGQIYARALVYGDNGAAASATVSSSSYQYVSMSMPKDEALAAQYSMYELSAQKFVKTTIANELGKKANTADIPDAVTVTNTGDVYIGTQLIRKVLTQAEYDLLDPPDPKVDYLIVPAST